jgi:2-polyprenyl-3-methyl-5-hydroxy-6-metoxy-1,4-benzoquinol methylase
MNENKRLESIAEKSMYAFGANGWTTLYSFNLIKRHLVGSSILELGPAEGLMTKLLYGTGMNLTIVEASKKFCNDIEKSYKNVTVYNKLFEDFNPSNSYDNIVLGHVLEHVADPLQLLNRVKSWLKPEGKILCAVPNSRSLHRQAAVIMGLLDFEEDLNEADIHHGHRRVFNPETFRSIFLKSGFKIDFFGGYWIKPFSNKQCEETHSPEMIDAFMKLGERYPDISAELFIAASLESL